MRSSRTGCASLEWTSNPQFPLAHPQTLACSHVQALPLLMDTNLYPPGATHVHLLRPLRRPRCPYQLPPACTSCPHLVDCLHAPTWWTVPHLPGLAWLGQGVQGITRCQTVWQRGTRPGQGHSGLKPPWCHLSPDLTALLLGPLRRPRPAGDAADHPAQRGAWARHAGHAVRASLHPQALLPAGLSIRG